jgi:hypothetical protein
VSTHPDELGVPRQDHYGQGRQPWDEILDANWAPEFCAGNVLKYLRRTKDPEHSLESARWYWLRLHELALGKLLPPVAERKSGRQIALGRANAAIVRLRELLTREELDKLHEPTR